MRCWRRRGGLLALAPDALWSTPVVPQEWKVLMRHSKTMCLFVLIDVWVRSLSSFYSHIAKIQQKPKSCCMTVFVILW